MWALKNENVNGIICMMGGDDSYRVFPYIDLNVIKENPKVFMGYSDIASWMAVFAKAGVRAYYGPNLLTPIAQPGELDGYTQAAIFKTIFSTDIIGDIAPSTETTDIQWKNITKEEVTWRKNSGYKVIQGNGCIRGKLFGGTVGPLRQIMGTEYFPNKSFFDNCILALEIGSPYGSTLAGLHELRAFDAAGVFKNAAGIVTGKLTEEEEAILLKFLKYEARREDIPVISNIDFVHRTPMTVLPMGAMAEIDCQLGRFSILEPGVTE